MIFPLKKILGQLFKSRTRSIMPSRPLSSRQRCPHISLDVLKGATNNFDENKILGSGGEGKVYFAKIKLDVEIIPVAVKYLVKNSKGFENEINTMSKIQHQNIVSLLGYCDEAGQKLLIYEYMENKSLADHLKNDSSMSLSWMQRLHICLDAARGIQHLHVSTDESAKGIIHRDIKPGNILLDNDWVAKISDFGLFKKSVANQANSSMITNVKGTAGYYAPEYITYNNVSRKTDVYALGVVLFQVLCNKMPWDRGEESYTRSESEDLGIWAQKNVDSNIKAEIFYASLITFAAIIQESLKMDPVKRATIHVVVSELEKALNYQVQHVEAMEGEILAKAIGSDNHLEIGFCSKAPSRVNDTGGESGFEYFNPSVPFLPDIDEGLTELQHYDPNAHIAHNFYMKTVPSVSESGSTSGSVTQLASRVYDEERYTKEAQDDDLEKDLIEPDGELEPNSFNKHEFVILQASHIALQVGYNSLQEENDSLQQELAALRKLVKENPNLNSNSSLSRGLELSRVVDTSPPLVVDGLMQYK